MKTSLTTSEHRVRDWLLDLVHIQWRALGVPFSVHGDAAEHEIIDPEALLWCTLEFFPTEPRLREQVLKWLRKHEYCLLQPRIRKIAQPPSDPRASIWDVLDSQWRRAPNTPSGPCCGQDSVEELQAFCHRLRRQLRTIQVNAHEVGRPERTTATALLRARDLFGGDARHLILLFLLANRSGARLRRVADWSAQSYRNISKVAQRWEAAGVLTVDRGHARLRRPGLWAQVLELDSPEVVLPDWRRFYDVGIQLLRLLNKAQARSLRSEGPAVQSSLHEAATTVEHLAEDTWPASQTLRDFARLLTGQD